LAKAALHQPSAAKQASEREVDRGAQLSGFCHLCPSEPQHCWLFSVGEGIGTQRRKKFNLNLDLAVFL
ncbi:MAG: hypothetical protein QHC67_18695, partial [Sphingobium sp.]|uniref:hypothetical protein n=1 Tax=Sphingobium sp. TaxID=1912891 RepID=UPI0029B50A7D